MQSVFANLQNLNGDDMQEIKNLVQQISTIMKDNGISQTSIVNALDGKCSRMTILNLFKGDGDFKVSTLLMVLDVIGADLHLETEKSREAIMAGDIASYRAETEQLRVKVAEQQAAAENAAQRITELQEKNGTLTGIVDSQQRVINRYIERMDLAEQDLRRKDKKIDDLCKKLNLW